MNNLLRAVVGSMVALCLVACSFNFRHADAVQGKAVQQKIDETITPMIKNYYPRLKIEPAQCEPIIAISQGTMGTCTLPVNGVPLGIRVASSGPPDMFKVDFGGAFFLDMATVEKIIENTLAHNYQIPIKAAAHCGEPQERLLQPGTYFVCTVEGSPLVHSARLKVSPNGQVFVFNVPGLKVASALPDSLLTVHKQGKEVVVSGAKVVAYIQQLIAADPASSTWHMTLACPAQVDLTGTKRGVCTAAMPNLSTPQRLGFWIDDAVGFRMRPIDAVVDQAKVQKMAQDDLNRRLTDNGDAADAVVVCDKGIIVVEPPRTFNCKATASGKRYKLVVTVEDYKGTVAWHGIPLN
ncbi:MAG TPA: DUF4333 domain-containing protein [Candidatus Baltobacteraceae bacterium]